MENCVLNGSLLTPLFGYGAYNGRKLDNKNLDSVPELRASEVKGMMRYLYRIACPSELTVLRKDEADIFGGSGDDGKEGAGHASPVRIVARIERGEKEGVISENVFYCKNNKNCFKNNHFQINFSKNKRVTVKEPHLAQSISMEWYRDLAALAFMLCGMGNRSRKGRGRAVIDDVHFNDRKGAAEWICTVLNKIAAASSREGKMVQYKYSRDDITGSYRIVPCYDRSVCEEKINRPIIMGIQFGELLRGNRYTQDKDVLDCFLASVDWVCHNVKREYGNTNKNENCEAWKKARNLSEIVGSGGKGGRFASALMIGFVKTDEGLYPVYIFLKAVKTREEVKNNGKSNSDGKRNQSIGCDGRSEKKWNIGRNANRDVKMDAHADQEKGRYCILDRNCSLRQEFITRVKDEYERPTR